MLLGMLVKVKQQHFHGPLDPGAISLPYALHVCYIRLSTPLGMMQVNQDSTIGPLQDHEFFPDFPAARVLGTKSGTLPDLLTT